MVFWNAKQTNKQTNKQASKQAIKQASKQANMKPQINKHKGKCVSFTDVGVRMYIYMYINIHTRHVLIEFYIHIYIYIHYFIYLHVIMKQSETSIPSVCYYVIGGMGECEGQWGALSQDSHGSR